MPLASLLVKLHIFTGHIDKLSIVGFFDFFIVYVISSFHHFFIITMTEISAASPNEEEQEQQITIREFMKTQKHFMENMQFMFQKHATATSTTQSSGPYRSRTDDKDCNDASQRESHDRAIHENVPGASRKRKCVNQVNQNSQDTVTLHPSDSESYLSEDSTCLRKDSEDPLSKYSKVDSDVKVGDQDNSSKDLLASVQEDFSKPIDTKLADILERIW